MPASRPAPLALTGRNRRFLAAAPQALFGFDPILFRGILRAASLLPEGVGQVGDVLLLLSLPAGRGMAVPLNGTGDGDGGNVHLS